MVLVILGGMTVGFILLTQSLFGVRRVATNGMYQGMSPSTGSVAMGPGGGIAQSLDAVAEYMMPEKGRSEPATAIMPPYPQPIDDALTVDERVYLKTAAYGVVADNVASYMQAVTNYVLSVDGRVLQSSMNTTDKWATGYLYVKVPVEKFDEANQTVVTNADEVVSQAVNAQDQTGTVVNYQEQVQELEERKADLELQLEEAETEVEKKRIEQQIKQVETQIQQAQERLTTQQTEVAYGALTVQVADSDKYFNPTGTGDGDLSDTLSEAWDAVVEILLVGVRLLIWVGVFAILWLPLVLVIWLIAKWLKKPKVQQ